MLNRILLFALCLYVLIGCGTKEPHEGTDLKSASWEMILKEASGTTVNFVMWQGNPVTNDYINNFVIPRVEEKYNINLEISGGQGPQIMQLIMGEKQAGIKKGQSDMVWINGETFFQLNQIDGLWGPFLQKIPNTRYIDLTNPFISEDFQQPINGMECPWGITQFALAYDTTRISDPPATLPELEEYVKAYPGTFTISNDFTGMSLLKTMMAEISGSPNGLDGPYDEELYQSVSDSLWNWINRNKKYFWKEGSTFPSEQSKMDQLFATGELNITYGFAEAGVEDNVLQGLFPKSTKVFAWKNGTVKNSNYLGISYNARNKAGAMAVINFLISPEAQLERLTRKEMRGNTILSIEKLPQEWQQKFEEAPGRKYGVSLEELENHAIKEPNPQYMINVYEEFRTEVIEK